MDIHLSYDEKDILYNYFKADGYNTINYIKLLEELCPNPLNINLNQINSTNNQNYSGSYNPYNDNNIKSDRYSDYTNFKVGDNYQPNTFNNSMNNYQPDTFNNSMNNYQPNTFNNSMNNNPTNYNQPNPYNDPYNLNVNRGDAFNDMSKSYPPQINTNYSIRYSPDSVKDIILRLRQLHNDNVWIGISQEGLDKILTSSNSIYLLFYRTK